MKMFSIEINLVHHHHLIIITIMIIIAMMKATTFIGMRILQEQFNGINLYIYMSMKIILIFLFDKQVQSKTKQVLCQADVLASHKNNLIIIKMVILSVVQ